MTKFKRHVDFSYMKFKKQENQYRQKGSSNGLWQWWKHYLAGKEERPLGMLAVNMLIWGVVIGKVCTCACSSGEHLKFIYIHEMNFAVLSYI